MFDQRRSKVDEPPGEGHVTCKAFERLDICVCLSIVSIEDSIDRTNMLETNELGCVFRDVRPL